ncbi:MAG: thioredoxin family protein [candidate division KSB1 bacterium]|nr:thioredoxin family protein [candidate division KSB1 bacterium]MDZ7275921.1 thioredoxin family protein [candidate division KSB1 bacterium]MDZ7285797.1 thioredoxin family protein [candidate division KSB1 bacterium]MDZ7298829.1 thioredoxin family protein [candidate division KSB1 bacterium]MDZ7309001.1 thioredoxin family protein [candidate division KSB1 bacterium]
MKMYVPFLLAMLAPALPVAFAGDIAIDKPAPNFTLKDVEGKSHSLADFKGKFVVLEWINFDCPFVGKHYRSGNMQKLQQTYLQKGVVWLSICSSAPGKQGHFTAEGIKKRLAEAKATPTAYLIDEDGTTGKLYGAKTTPHMFIIDPKGTLIYAGGIDDIRSTDMADVAKAKNYVAAALDEALAGKPVTQKVTTPYGCSVKY